MSELVIFETEHRQEDPRVLYPTDRTVSQRAIEECHNWFDDRRARVVFDSERPVIESFVALRTDRGKRSAYVRYEGDGPEDPLVSFRTQLARVIDDNGWELLERGPSPRDDTWLFKQLMDGNLEQNDPQELEFDDAEDAQALDAVLNQDHQAVVAVRTYRHAMDAALAFADDGRSIVMRHRKPAGQQTVGANLELIVQPDKSQAYVLSTETRKAIEEYKNREESHINDLQAAIRGLEKHDLEPPDIFEHIEDQFADSYPRNSSRFSAYLRYGFEGLSESPGNQEQKREKINRYMGQHFTDFEIPAPEIRDQIAANRGKSGRPGGRTSTTRSQSATSTTTGDTGRDHTSTGGIYGDQGKHSGDATRMGRSQKHRLRVIILAAIVFIIIITTVAGMVYFGMPGLSGGENLLPDFIGETIGGSGVSGPPSTP